MAVFVELPKQTFWSAWLQHQFFVQFSTCWKKTWDVGEVEKKTSALPWHWSKLKHYRGTSPASWSCSCRSRRRIYFKQWQCRRLIFVEYLSSFAQLQETRMYCPSCHVWQSSSCDNTYRKSQCQHLKSEYLLNIEWHRFELLVRNGNLHPSVLFGNDICFQISGFNLWHHLRWIVGLPVVDLICPELSRDSELPKHCRIM